VRRQQHQATAPHAVTGTHTKNVDKQTNRTGGGGWREIGEFQLVCGVGVYELVASLRGVTTNAGAGVFTLQYTKIIIYMKYFYPWCIEAVEPRLDLSVAKILI
jgi:hypothetical protein